jgi:predicted aspartyl protease
MTLRNGWLCALAALALAGPASAQPASGDPPNPSPSAAPPSAAPGADQTPDVKLVRDLTSRLTIGVTIDGQGPYEFLIDTGSDRTVISRELATALNLQPGPMVHMQESTGTDIVQTVVIPQLQIGKRTLTGVEAPAVSAADLGAAGMLGVDALRDLHVVMDFRAMRLSSSPSRREPDEAGTIVVRGKNRLGELILVDAEVRGVPVYVVLDSGAELSVGNAALLKLLTGRRGGPTPPRQGEVIGVTGRRIPVSLENIPEAHIGRLEIDNMTLGFAELPVFERFGLSREPAILLGMDVLSRCRRVSVDIRRREATFTLN